MDSPETEEVSLPPNREGFLHHSLSSLSSPETEEVSLPPNREGFLHHSLSSLSSPETEEVSLPPNREGFLHQSLSSLSSPETEVSLPPNREGFLHQSLSSLPSHTQQGRQEQTTFREDTATSDTPTHDTSFKSFQMNVEDCRDTFDFISEETEFAADQGEITGLTGQSNSTKLYCKWKIVIPKRKYMLMKVEFDKPHCLGIGVRIYYKLHGEATMYPTYNCQFQIPFLFITDHNVAYFQLAAKATAQFRIIFNSSTVSFQTLNMMMTSAMSGYITSPGYDGRSTYAPWMTASQMITLPDHHVLMISFDSFLIHKDMISYHQCEDGVSLFVVDNFTQTETKVWERCGIRYIAPEVYNQSLRIHFFSNAFDNDIGFKMRFTFHSSHQPPTKLANGLYNCSVYYYAQFKQHVDCNMLQECEGREDEGGHCPFSSPACDGSVAVGHKCYTFVRAADQTPFYYMTAKFICLSRNSTLAIIKTIEEWNAMHRAFNHIDIKRDYIFIGIIPYDISMPQYYRKAFQWEDRSINYRMKHSSTGFERREGDQVPIVCIAYYVKYNHQYSGKCSELQSVFAICESEINQNNTRTFKNRPVLPKVRVLEETFPRFDSKVVTCPSGHISVSFLSCHPESECGVIESLSQCPFYSPVSQTHGHRLVTTDPFEAVATFQCGLQTTKVPYSFVCDFRTDCKDNSDEEFCVHHRSCSGFVCENRQCIEHVHVCDTFRHCLDGSDEAVCNKESWRYVYQSDIPSPALILFDGNGYFQKTPMQESETCPPTHFLCPGEYHDCLPVYVLCNGVYDCLDQEDEAQCDGTTVCPGFYRCWDSNVCVHADHVCDGWPQCPRHDDELLCDVTCPEGCRCQGQAFVCHQPFPAQAFPDLRYLDASGSGMKPHQVTDIYYLIFLKMKTCLIEVLPTMILENLVILNVDENLITSINMAIFVPTKNLQELSLAGNPLTLLHSGNVSGVSSGLLTLDVSRTHLTSFEALSTATTPHLMVLNVSYSKINIIESTGIKHLTQLKQLDIRGNSIKDYPRRVFKSLTHLSHLSTSEFKFCCKAILPSHFENIVCLSPQDQLSSCEHLIHSTTHRALLWLLCVMSLVGNAGKLINKSSLKGFTSEPGIKFYVVNLCLADLLMGVYLAIVGVADTMYRGKYLWHQNTWMSSLLCHTAGFLSLLSSEVSAFIICLITLDRFIVLRFPLTTIRFGNKSAVYSTLIVWMAGVVISAIPLLATASRWEFYGRTSICTPLPMSGATFSSPDYFSIIIDINFILFLFVAAGQTFIYCSVQSRDMIETNATRAQDISIVHRLSTIIIFDMLCWVLVGVLNLMSSFGVSFPSEVSVVLAVIVLPVNSALNPVLHIFSERLDKRRILQELKTMKLLEARIQSKKTRTGRAFNNDKHLNLTIDDAVNILCKRVNTGTLDDINLSLISYDLRLDHDTANTTVPTQN